MDSSKPLFAITKQKVTTYPEWGFRPGIPVVPRPINFVFINGGMGDYICWMQAILWLVAHATWVQGRVVVPDYFIPLAEYWLKGTDWKVWGYEVLKDAAQNDIPVRGPINLVHESLNATGAHLLDCGFAYYACQNPPPEGWNHYPKFKQNGPLDSERFPALAALHSKYCVITTGKTSPSRHVPGGYWNYVIDHVIERGFTPVFLGASEMRINSGQKLINDVRTKFDTEVNYERGIDLRDKTTLLEAAAILDRAAFVVGHDNGLLHLAGCTETPIVFGYNVAAPIHRRPRRLIGRTYDVTLTQKDINCIHCQSRTNFVIGFVFHECFYKTAGKVHGFRENECIDLLFANEAARWKSAINQCIEELPRD